MTYHPIIGISIFILSILAAYLLGKFISRKYKSSSYFQKKIKETDGDAAMPDAPWVNKKNENKD